MDAQNKARAAAIAFLQYHQIALSSLFSSPHLAAIAASLLLVKHCNSQISILYLLFQEYVLGALRDASPACVSKHKEQDGCNQEEAERGQAGYLGSSLCTLGTPLGPHANIHLFCRLSPSPKHSFSSHVWKSFEGGKANNRTQGY